MCGEDGRAHIASERWQADWPPGEATVRRVLDELENGIPAHGEDMNPLQAAVMEMLTYDRRAMTVCEITDALRLDYPLPPTRAAVIRVRRHRIDPPERADRQHVQIIAAARIAADRELGEGSDYAAAFSAARCDFLGALTRAKERADFVLPAVLALAPDLASDAFEAVAKRQLELVWLDGCLVGLHIEGCNPNQLTGGALSAAMDKLSSMLLGMDEACLRRERRPAFVSDVLAIYDLEPETAMRAAAMTAWRLVTPLDDFTLTAEQQQVCVEQLMAQWLGAFATAAVARREPSREVNG